MDLLIKALLDGDQDQAIFEVNKLLDAGISKQIIITDGVEKAMEQLDAKCTVEQFNLLEIMLCGRAVMGVMRKLFPPGAPHPTQTKGTVVVAALEGDVHDLGKNILKTVFIAKGYRVVDCGKDCSLDRFIDTAEQETALAMGISGLITTIVPQLRRIRDNINDRGLGHIKLIAGGAVLKQYSAENLNVDYVAQNAFDGLHYLDQVVGGK